jgi:hypothetical protein
MVTTQRLNGLLVAALLIALTPASDARPSPSIEFLSPLSGHVYVDGASAGTSAAGSTVPPVLVFVHDRLVVESPLGSLEVTIQVKGQHIDTMTIADTTPNPVTQGSMTGLDGGPCESHVTDHHRVHTLTCLYKPSAFSSFVGSVFFLATATTTDGGSLSTTLTPTVVNV